MENKLVMTTDLIHCLVELVAKHGNVPILLSDSSSEKAMIPLRDAHIIEISKPGVVTEKAIMLADYILCEEDGSSLGWGLSEE